MTQASTLTGQDIAEAYGAVETLLERALGETDTTNREYVVLRVLAARGPVESPTSLHEYLTEQRQLDLSPTAVEELLAGLEARALATGTTKDAPGPARLTAHGTELLRGLAEALAPRTRELFSGIAAEDLATAHQVLREIIDRAPSIASPRERHDRTRRPLALTRRCRRPTARAPTPPPAGPRQTCEGKCHSRRRWLV